MNRTEEYRAMLAEEAARPLPPELLYLEGRVRARAAGRRAGRRRRAAAAAALGLCLALGTAMACLGGFDRLAAFFGGGAEQLAPYYQPAGLSMEFEDCTAQVEGVIFTTHSYTVLVRYTAKPGTEGEGWKKRAAAFHTCVARGGAGEDPDPFLRFMAPFLEGRMLDENGSSGWAETLDGGRSDCVYQWQTMSTPETLEDGAGQTLLLYFPNTADGAPSDPETGAAGGTLFSVPVEHVLEERTVELEGSPYVRLSLSPVTFLLETRYAYEDWWEDEDLRHARPELVLVYRDGSRWEADGEKQFGADYAVLPYDISDAGMVSLKWQLRRSPPDLKDLAGVELEGVFHPVSP